MSIMVLKVAGKSNPATVAGAIANNIREGKSIEIVAMGPQSVNQSIKAMTIARSYLVDDKIDLLFRSEFMHLDLDGERKSAIKLIVITQNVSTDAKAVKEEESLSA